MLAAAAGLAAGIAVLHSLPALPAVTTPLGVAAVALSLTFVRRLRVFGLAAALGFGLAWWQGSTRLAQDWPCGRARESVALAGMVAAPALVRPTRTEFDVLTSPAHQRAGLPPRVRIAWYRAEAIPLPGEQWQLQVRLRCRRSLRNPGGHDRELSLLADGIGATAVVQREPAPRRLRPAGWRLPVQQARAWAARWIATATAPSPSTGVLQGLAVGVRGSMSDAQWRALAATGTAHLVAISGTHVTAFAFVALAALRLALRWWRPRWIVPRRVAAEAVLLLAAAGAYTLLAGAALPALRTLAMLSLASLLRVWRREPGTFQVLALAALALLAIDPLALLQAGFWLSFVATAALLAWVWPGTGGKGAIRRFAGSQAAVTIALLPPSAVAFGGVSVVAPLANAAAIPLFSAVLLPLVLAGLALAPLSAWLSQAIFAVAAALMDRCWPVLEALADWPAAMWYPAAPPLWLAACGLAAAFLLLRLPAGGLRLAAIAVIAALLLRTTPAPPAGGFALTVLDVGQGLAVVVRTATHVLLFDAGPRWYGGGSAGDSVVLPFLHHEGLRHVDLMVLSHADADHTGGAAAVLGGVDVAGVLLGTGRFAPDIRGAPCRRGQRWAWDGVEFAVLHPAGSLGWSDNDGSCVLRVSGGGGTLLLTADIQAAAESELSGPTVRADVALVPHHGSGTSSSAQFVAAVRPRWALVSAGADSRWGMPLPGVVARWQAAGASVLATSEAGALQLQVTPLRADPPARLIRAEPRWWRARDAPAHGDSSRRRGRV